MGSIVLTITPADGTQPVVTVSGPKQYTTSVGTSVTLTVPVGTYTVVADSAAGPDSVVGSVIDTGHVTGSPVTVTANADSSVGVTYATKGHVGGLWIGNGAYASAYVFTSSQLRVTNYDLLPADSIVTGGFSLPGGMAIDASGNLWVDDNNSDTIRMYTPAARNQAGAKTPSSILVSASLGAPWSLTFDSHGNLWVVNCGNKIGSIVAFTPSQLAAAGNQTASVVIVANPVSYCPQGIAFDPSGDAWVTDYSNNRLLEYSPAQLATSGTLIPIDTIGSTGGSLTLATGAAFDASGNLWVAKGSGGVGGNTVVEFTPAQLAAGGAPTPNTTLAMPDTADPYGLAFDRRGSLWVTDAVNWALYGFTSAQLAASGSPTPQVSIIWPYLQYTALQPVFDPYTTAVAPPAASRVRPAPRARASARSRLIPPLGLPRG
jgi:sugar lactone lactonase YvrE